MITIIGWFIKKWCGTLRGERSEFDILNTGVALFWFLFCCSCCPTLAIKERRTSLLMSSCRFVMHLDIGTVFSYHRMMGKCHGIIDSLLSSRTELGITASDMRWRASVSHSLILTHIACGSDDCSPAPWTASDGGVLMLHQSVCLFITHLEYFSVSHLMGIMNMRMMKMECMTSVRLEVKIRWGQFSCHHTFIGIDVRTDAWVAYDIRVVF